MSARDKILASLRSSLVGTTPIADPFDATLVDQPWRYDPAERVTRLKELMTAVHAEVLLTNSNEWPQLLGDVLAARKINKLLIAPMLYMVKPGVDEKLKAFVKNGGTLVVSYFSGYVDEHDLVTLGGYPGKRSIIHCNYWSMTARLKSGSANYLMTCPPALLAHWQVLPQLEHWCYIPLPPNHA